MNTDMHSVTKAVCKAFSAQSGRYTFESQPLCHVLEKKQTLGIHSFHSFQWGMLVFFRSEGAISAVERT